MSVSTNISYDRTGGGYYALPTGAAAKSAAAKATAEVPQNLLADAYQIDLSPAARSYLSGSNAASSVLGNFDGFTLNQTQKDKIDSIIAKFADAPYTQETFNQIQAELQRAGLSPDQLAVQQQVKDFSTTQMLIEALGGKTVHNPMEAQDDSKYDSQKKSYLQQLGSAFQNIAAKAIEN